MVFNIIRRVQFFRSGEQRMRPFLLYAVGISLALGTADAYAAMDAPNGAIIQMASDQDQGHAIHDLGLLPPANSAEPTAAPASASTVNGAEPIPELPTWGMMLLCLAGLGLAAFKKGRKDRLSPGIE
jgi:hypothetical protein